MTTRLEETNVRMKKLSQVFTTCEESFSDTEPHHHDNDDTFQPLVRTTRIVSGKSPLDDVVEKMIQSPDNQLSPSSVPCGSTVSSAQNCLLSPILPPRLNHLLFCPDLYSLQDFSSFYELMFIPGKLSINVQSCGCGSHS